MVTHGVVTHGVVTHGVMRHGVMRHGVMRHGVVAHEVLPDEIMADEIVGGSRKQREVVGGSKECQWLARHPRNTGRHVQSHQSARSMRPLIDALYGTSLAYYIIRSHFGAQYDNFLALYRY